MSRRKTRPTHGSAVTADMSLRDTAAALGVSVAELSRWKALATLRADEFERRLRLAQDACIGRGRLVTAEAVLRAGTPVPARGRVQRALAIVSRMSPQERADLLQMMGGRQ